MPVSYTHLDVYKRQAPTPIAVALLKRPSSPRFSTSAAIGPATGIDPKKPKQKPMISAASTRAHVHQTLAAKKPQC